MPVPIPRISGNKKRKFQLVIDEFKKGVMTQTDESRTPVEAAVQAKNLMQVQDALWQNRWGSRAYGETYTSLDAWDVVVADDGDGTTTQKLFIIDNGTPKVSTDGGAWSTVTGGTFTAGTRATTAQLGNRLYIANGTDALAYYDIAGNTIQTYTGLSAPSSTSATASSTLTDGTRSYNAYYRVTAVNDVGETGASATFSVSGSIDKKREQWASDGTEYIDLSWTGDAGATGYNIYYGDNSGYEVFLDTADTTSYRDDGTATPNVYLEYPDDDTTSGPVFAHISVIGNRLWGTKDPSNPWRVYWSGVGNSQGAWSPFYGGGYVDIAKGSKQRPQKAVSFRTGKGDPIATVLTTDPAGNGTTYQIELVASSVGSTPLIIPATYPVEGQTGSNAPHAVVQARNKVFFPNVRGLFTLGSKPSLLNVLATDEISVNIRPSWRNLKKSAMANICGYEYDGKLFFSVPYGSANNNQIWILDLERKNWALHWDIGVRGFLEYTDSDGVNHFLAVPVSGTKFIEFSESFKGDSGTAYQSIYQTPLIHVSDDHTKFAHIEKVTVEFGRPKGSININVSGTQRSKAFSTLKTKTISAGTSNAGFSAFGFSEKLFSDISQVPDTFSSASLKKEIKIKKPLNNFKVTVSSSDIDQEYAINRIIVDGRMVNVPTPSSWRS